MWLRDSCSVALPRPDLGKAKEAQNGTVKAQATIAKAGVRRDLDTVEFFGATHRLILGLSPCRWPSVWPCGIIGEGMKENAVRRKQHGCKRVEGVSPMGHECLSLPGLSAEEREQ